MQFRRFPYGAGTDELVDVYRRLPSWQPSIPLGPGRSHFPDMHPSFNHTHSHTHTYPDVLISPITPNFGLFFAHTDSLIWPCLPCYNISVCLIPFYLLSSLYRTVRTHVIPIQLQFTTHLILVPNCHLGSHFIFQARNALLSFPFRHPDFFAIVILGTVSSSMTMLRISK